MDLPTPSVGIVFDIDALGGGFYGSAAWRLFMRHFRPTDFPACSLLEGDTNASLSGRAREFCIAVSGPSLDPAAVKGIFGAVAAKGLAPPARRFIDKPQLGSEPLVIRGRIDDFGSFITAEWTRVDHDLCKEAGWSYRPQRVSGDPPLDLAKELKELSRPTRAHHATRGKGAGELRRWWQFWK